MIDDEEIKINLTGVLPSGSLESSRREIIGLQRTKNKIEICLLSGILISMRETLRTESASSYHYWRRCGRAGDICTRTLKTSGLRHWCRGGRQ